MCGYITNIHWLSVLLFLPELKVFLMVLAAQRELGSVSVSKESGTESDYWRNTRAEAANPRLRTPIDMGGDVSCMDDGREDYLKQVFPTWALFKRICIWKAWEICKVTVILPQKLCETHNWLEDAEFTQPFRNKLTVCQLSSICITPVLSCCVKSIKEKPPFKELRRSREKFFDFQGGIAKDQWGEGRCALIADVQN